MPAKNSDNVKKAFALFNGMTSIINHLSSDEIQALWEQVYDESKKTQTNSMKMFAEAVRMKKLEALNFGK